MRGSSFVCVCVFIALEATITTLIHLAETIIIVVIINIIIIINLIEPSGIIARTTTKDDFRLALPFVY